MKLVLLLVAVALGVTAFVTPVKIGGPAGLVCLFIVLWLLLKMERSPKPSDPPAGDPARRRDGAWLALAYRAEGDIDRARAAVERSKTDDPTFEAHAADSAILLTEGNIEDAMMAWSEATKLSPSDEDGHFLHLVLYCIWAEIMAHSEEDAGGVTLHLRHTPVTRCAILLLDGRPREAMGAVSRGTTDPLEMLACGLALFRVGQVDAARALWAVLVDAIPGKASLSLKRLMR
jgi:tetratricopeptide (TPR) repeat protein